MLSRDVDLTQLEGDSDFLDPDFAEETERVNRLISLLRASGEGREDDDAVNRPATRSFRSAFRSSSVGAFLVPAAREMLGDLAGGS